MFNPLRLALRFVTVPTVVTALVLYSPATSSPTHLAIRAGLLVFAWTSAGWAFWFSLDPERVARAKAKAEAKKAQRQDGR